MFDINNASWVSRKYLKVGEMVFFWGVFVISGWTSLVTQAVKKLPARQEMQVWSLGWGDPLEKEMTTYPSNIFWRIPRTEEPGGLQSMGSQRDGYHWATNTFTSLWLQYNLDPVFQSNCNSICSATLPFSTLTMVVFLPTEESFRTDHYKMFPDL